MCATRQPDHRCPVCDPDKRSKSQMCHVRAAWFAMGTSTFKTRVTALQDALGVPAGPPTAVLDLLKLMCQAHGELPAAMDVEAALPSVAQP
jgi:hypothetical protein